MADKIYSFKISLFFIFFLSLQIYSYTDLSDDYEWLTLYKEDLNLTKDVENSNKTSYYAIEFKIKEDESYYDGPNYLKIGIKTDSAPVPLLCFSNDDPTCNSRQNLVKNPTGNSVFIWVKKEQYEDKNSEPYFSVTCPEDSCSYTIEITGGSYATINSDLVYSYLVTNKNKEMAFKVEPLEPKRLVICLEGSNTAQLVINYENVFQNDNIKCINTKIYNTNSYQNFKIVKATENDYITISIHQYEIINDDDNPLLHYGRANDLFAIPNGPIITSFIYSGHTSEECFPINKEIFTENKKYYITGKIYNKYAWFYLEKEDGEYIEETDTEIIDGQLAYILELNKETSYICFEIPTTEDFYQTSVMFSFQIINYETIIPFFEYTHPQLSGQIYRRLLPKGYITYYYVAKSEISEKYDYYLSNIKGNAKLYIDDKCSTFPDCHYNKNDLNELNINNPLYINNQIMWHTSTDASSALNLQKNLMIVYCDENNEFNIDYCEFETSIFYKGQDISLIENQKFYKYVVEGETGLIIADLKNNRIIERLTFDIMLFSGDVSFNVINQESTDESPEIKYYYISNKIVINAYKPRQRLQKVIIEYKSNTNSLFSIKYSVDSLNKEQYQESLISGENYLVQINPLLQSKIKLIKMKNYYNDKTPFLINFFALNCDFEVKDNNDNIISFSDGYAQKYINKGEDLDEEGYYQYVIKIKDYNLPNYNDKLCGIYISGVEIDNKLSREIIVPININQQIIFDDTFKKIKFSVHIINIYKDITYRVNVIDKAYYCLNGYINGKKMAQIDNVITAVTTTYYLYSGEIKMFCKDNELCIFSLEVEYKEQVISSTNNPMIEITFREVNNIPVYLQQGIAKLDYVCGDQIYYLYTDLGEKDVAEINLNFLREFGFLWAKVVKKDLSSSEDDKPDWKNLYKLPGPEMDNNLSYDTYTKKLIVTADDTKDCINGCYLIMGIQINDIGDYIPNLYYYYFSIIAKITPSNLYYIDIPKIVIQIDEYIIGALNYEELEDKICSNFYEIWLPHDSQKVEFDWQSNHANLYINIGSERPTPKNADFILSSPGRHSLLYLNKSNILETAKKKGIIDNDETSIEDINMVIGIWTDKKDSINTELYSLRIHETESEDKLEIIPVPADQKIICKPNKVKENEKEYYRCYFMIIYDYDVALFNPLFVYGNSINPSANVDLYANFIQTDIYDSYNEEYLRGNISTSENAEFNTFKEDIKYIYVSNIPWDYPNYLFVTIESNTNDELMLINSIPLYDPSSDQGFIVYPNAFTEQIFSCKGELLKMSFPGNEGLNVILNVINGEAEIKWDDSNDIYYTKGNGDRINLLSSKNSRNLVIRNLKPVNDDSEEEIEKNPGFLFYITYKSRTDNLNFDEINYGKSTLITYKDSSLPIILYSKIDNNNYDDLNIAINFKDNPSEIKGDYTSSPITFIAAIMSENAIIKAKYNKYMDMTPNNYKEGFYYPGTKTGLLYFTKEEIEEYDIKESDNPSIYIRIESENDKNIQNTEFNVETQIIGINTDISKENIIPLENKYYFATLGNKDEIIYPLKLYKNKDYIRIEIAFNSPNLDFCINQDKTLLKNQTFDYFVKKKSEGKILLTFKKNDKNMIKIYLHIFKKDKNKIEDFSNNYIFKYINAESEKDFIDYSIKSPKIKIEKYKESELDVIKATFDQVQINEGKANITYILKIVGESDYKKDEEINTIANTESLPIIMTYERNPISSLDKITLIAKGKSSEWNYLNVIAQIQQNNTIEYISYDGLLKSDLISDDTTEDSNDNTTLILSIAIPVGIILIVIIIFIVCKCRKKKDITKEDIEQLNAYELV